MAVVTQNHERKKNTYFSIKFFKKIASFIKDPSTENQSENTHMQIVVKEELKGC